MGGEKNSIRQTDKHTDMHYVNLYIDVYTYMFVGCVVVINRLTTKQDNMKHST